MKTVSTDLSGSPSYKMRTGCRGFARSRLQNFGLTMVVMGVSFGLYYLGFFGGVEGPLSAERIGDALACLGFSGRHLLAVCLSLTAMALTWNWLYYALRRLWGGCMPGAGRHASGTQLGVVKKGALGHFLWMMFLVISAIVFYHM
jgi:hypothetical protein